MLFVQSDDDALFRHEKWSYTRKYVMDKISDKTCYLIVTRSKESKHFNEEYVNHCKLLSFFTHWVASRNNNYYIHINSGVKKDGYFIDDAYIFDTQGTKFALQPHDSTDLRKHQCNEYCKRFLKN